MLSSISGAMTRLSSCRVSRKWLALPLVFVVGGVYLGTPQTSGHQPSSYQPYKGDLTPFVLTPTPTVTSTPASPTPEPTFTPSPAPSASRNTSKAQAPTRTLRGEASWGYGFKGHIVTRYKRGTIIRVCGPLGCTPKVRSWGYGPAKYTGRIADLDVNVFEDVCGPRSIGVCQIRLEVWK